MVKERSARRQQIEPTLPVMFRRESLTALVKLMREQAIGGTDADAFVRDACQKLATAPADGHELMRCAFRQSSWARLVSSLNEINAGGLALVIDRKVRLAVIREQDAAEIARERRAKAENDAELKKAADALRERDAEEERLQAGLGVGHG